jgi:two-component system, NtrC family, response regulator HydG
MLHLLHILFHATTTKHLQPLLEKYMLCFEPEKGLSQSCFETILQTIAEGVFIIDTSGVIRFCNKGLEAMSGLPAASINGKRCRDIMVCACGSMSECGLLTGARANNLECQLKRADGSRLPVLKNGRPVAAPDGSIMGAVETLTDISALKQAERKTAALEEQVQREGGRFHLLVGKSRPMRDVFELIDLAAPSNATVLITGETGTGKELAARTIHEKSGRTSGPLVKVNCSALTESLLESELFGHAKGAFTGAIKDRIGRFEAADGGTLFLDEIGEVSPYIQVKLLRFLQEREFERVGESEARKADVRIIAATNRDLRDLVRRGDFRDDLYYRLKVFPIHMPPLRERKDDIGLLIGHFIDKFNRQTGKAIESLGSEAALTTMDYCWPGNIRELENAIEHAFVTCSGKEIGVFDLPLEIRRVELRVSTCTPGREIASAPASVLGKRKRISRENVEQALSAHRGSRDGAARSLGIDRTTLWRYLKKWSV